MNGATPHAVAGTVWGSWDHFGSFSLPSDLVERFRFFSPHSNQTRPQSHRRVLTYKWWSSNPIRRGRTTAKGSREERRVCVSKTRRRMRWVISLSSSGRREGKGSAFTNLVIVVFQSRSHFIPWTLSDCRTVGYFALYVHVDRAVTYTRSHWRPGFTLCVCLCVCVWGIRCLQPLIWLAGIKLVLGPWLRGQIIHPLNNSPAVTETGSQEKMLS